MLERIAATIAVTPWIEARYVHPSAAEDPLPIPHVSLLVRDTRIIRQGRPHAREMRQPIVVPKKGASASTIGNLFVRRTRPVKAVMGHEAVVSGVVRGTIGHRDARRRSPASRTVRRSVPTRLLHGSRKPRTVAELGFSFRATTAQPRPTPHSVRVVTLNYLPLRGRSHVDLPPCRCRALSLRVQKRRWTSGPKSVQRTSAVHVDAVPQDQYEFHRRCVACEVVTFSIHGTTVAASAFLWQSQLLPL